MSDTEVTPGSPDLCRSRLIHAAVFHPAEFMYEQVEHLITAAVVGSRDGFAEQTLDLLRRAADAAPQIAGCCDAGR